MTEKKTYTVTVTRGLTFQVEAEDHEHATELAEELIERDDFCEARATRWEVDFVEETDA